MGYSESMTRAYTRDELEPMDTDVLDRMAFGVGQGDQVSVDPKQVRILYPCDLENPEARFSQEGMAWVRSVSFEEPVEVSVDDEGRFCLEDGHHRRFAAEKLGLMLKATVTAIKGKPIERLLAAAPASAPGRKPKP